MKRLAILLLTLLSYIVPISAQTIKCNDFLDHVGVSGANNWNDANNLGWQVPDLYAKAEELGVRWFRTGEWLGYDPAPYGLKVTFATGTGSSYYPDINTIPANLALGQQYGSSLMIVEGPNEPDVDSAGAVSNVVNWQEALWNEVNALKTENPTFSNLKVAGPSMAHSFGYTKLPDLSAWSDYANTHPYTWEQSELQPRLNDWLERSELVHPNQLKMATEMGTPNKLSVGGVSPEADAIYITRSYLYLYKLGFRYIANFRLWDNTPNFKAGWGMIDAEGNETPQYTSLQNLLTLLDDNSSAFSPETLNYSLSGNLNDLEQMVFQKSDGTFCLALWLAVDSFDEENKKLIQTSRKITVNLATAITEARTYKPSNPDNLANGTNVIKRHVNPSSFEVRVHNHVLLIALTPASTPATAFQGTYKLLARHSGKALAVDLNEQTNGGFSDATADGVNVFQFGTNNDPNRLWNLQPVGDGYHKIISVYSSKALAVDRNQDTNGGYSDATANGVNVFQYATREEEDDNRLWKIAQAADGYYTLTSKYSGRTLDVGQASEVDGANVQQWGTGVQNPTHRQWQLVSVNVNTREAVVQRKGELGVPLSTKEDLRVYPNPAGKLLTVAVGQEDYQVALYDLSGRKVLERDQLSGQATLDISGLQPGVYLLKLRDSQQAERRQRLLVE